MVLYFSAGTDPAYFRQCQEQELVKSGYQAQKFNQLVIEGLGEHTEVTAVGNPPFRMSLTQKIPAFSAKTGRITYKTLACRPGKLRKFWNFRDAYRYGAEVCAAGTVEGIVCDAINPLAALCAQYLGKRYGLPALAVVTDIPSYLSDRPSRLSRMAEGLMKTFDGYILLTEGMQPIVNPKGKPTIIMEGLCDSKVRQAEPEQYRKPVCLYTGSLCPGTGIENLIEGFGKYRPEGYTLALYGSGSMEDDLRKNPPTGVFYGGAVANTEAVRLQRESALLINPRPTNLRHANLAFPSKIMEYMASGTPVLTTRLPGIPGEYFDYLYTCDDTPEALGQAIAEILAIPEAERLEKGANAREFVLNRKNNIYQTGRILDLIRRCGRETL